MANADGQPGFVGELLQFDFPQAHARTVGAAAVRRDHEPIAFWIGASVQDEAHLIGDWRPARRAIGRKLRFVQLDQVLGLTARAIKAVVKPLGRAVREIGVSGGENPRINGAFVPDQGC
jgi:hypothetical protein